MTFKNLKSMELNKEEIKNLTKDINVELNLYLGERWKSIGEYKIIDLNHKKTFKSVGSFLRYMDSEIEKNLIWDFLGIESDLIYKLNQIIQYFNYNNASYINNIKNAINECLGFMGGHSIFLSESTLFALVKKEGIFNKNNYYFRGFLYFYQDDISSNNYAHNAEWLNGFQHATFINANKDKEKAWDEIGAFIKGYKKDYEEFENKKRELDKWRDEKEVFLEQENAAFKTKSDKTIEELKYEKGKLMLSAPLEMWHKRLEIYNGGKYTKKEGKEFEFVHEKSKDNKGKIFKDKLWSILWSILGLATIMLILTLILCVFNEEIWKNSKKLVIFMSFIGSFALFIYGYILRILVKNWITSRHISEEITERISLTQFYLTLIQEKQINESKTDFAISEIFKRINTGLIKEEKVSNSSLLESIKQFTMK